MNMENNPLIKFIKTTKSDDKIVDMYTKIRAWLQREGHTTESSEKISGAPAEIWYLKNEITKQIEKLRDDLKRYGILDNDLFNKYILNRLREVNKKYPLKDELDD